MKSTYFILFSIILLMTSSCINNEPVVSDEIGLPEKGQIGVYYFRTSIRCETCDAIEKFIKDEMNNKYAEEVKSGKVVFRQFNLDDEEVADFALDFKVIFKSLIIIKDEQRINLTNDAFLYADSNPEKLKQLFEKTLDEI